MTAGLIFLWLTIAINVGFTVQKWRESRRWHQLNALWSEMIMNGYMLRHGPLLQLWADVTRRDIIVKLGDEP